MIIKYVSLCIFYTVFSRCQFQNLKTVPYRNLPNSGNVVVTASAVVYLQYKYNINIFYFIVLLMFMLFYFLV
jgi:hypothetical protein